MLDELKMSRKSEARGFDRGGNFYTSSQLTLTHMRPNPLRTHHAQKGTRRMSSPPVLRCREITASDTDSIVSLLTRGFNPQRTRDYWLNSIRRLSEHQTPAGFPRYGYLLESDGVPVGVLLTIFSSLFVNDKVNDAINIRCNFSSWFVEPEFRSYASLLVSRALKYKNVIYYNISPAQHTWPILEAQGYTPFSRGLFVAIPLLCRSVPGSHVQAVTSRISPGKDLPAFEADLLVDHASYGCLSLICKSGTERHPFVFRLSRKYHLVPRAHLIYCRDLTDFVQFAGAIGRYLGLRGIPIADIDSNGPIPELIGKYRDGRPKFFKGPRQTRLGDLAYTELAMFGP